MTILPGTTSFPTIDDEAALAEETDGDNSSPAMEELTFWTNLEQSLAHVKSELSKPQVLLTLHLLKHAKRFVATIALENNTGLDGAETHVNDVANFLRRCPRLRL